MVGQKAYSTKGFLTKDANNEGLLDRHSVGMAWWGDLCHDASFDDRGRIRYLTAQGRRQMYKPDCKGLRGKGGEELPKMEV